MLRRRPCALAISTARSTAAVSPLTTAWPAALSLATSQTPASAASAATASTVGEVEAEHRRHGALADRYRCLHGPAAQPQQARGIADVEAAGRGQRRIFAERMAGDEPAEPASRRPLARLQRAQRRERGGHQRRLGVLGQAQRARRALEDQRG